MIIFFIGMLIGLVVAAPIGPVGLLCVRKTLEFGFKGTLAVGLGTSLADAIYAGIALYGLTAVSEFMLTHIVYFKVLGGILLLGLAVKEFYSKNRAVESVKITSKGIIGIIAITFILTCFNPIGIASFIGIFAMLGETLLSMNNAWLLIVGVFAGSMGWYLMVGKIVHRSQHLLPDRFILSVRKVSAVILAAFALWAFLSAFI
jgi:putative LysE/RhtB family amino acid efflux pump